MHLYTVNMQAPKNKIESGAPYKILQNPFDFVFKRRGRLVLSISAKKRSSSLILFIFFFNPVPSLQVIRGLSSPNLPSTRISKT